MRLARCAETGLGVCAALLPPVLALLPHGAAPLAVLAGLCAAGLVAASAPRWADLAALRHPAIILGGLILWGALSAAWSIDPWRSLIIDARLSGLAAAALALAAAARLAAPRRLTLFLFAGTALGIVLAFYDLASAGGLSRHFSTRDFNGARLNQLAAWVAVILLPAAALALCRGKRFLALAVAAVMAAAVYTLDDTTAKIALALGLPMTGLIYLRRRAVARIAALLAMLAILTAPMTLPFLAHQPAFFATVDGFKSSAGHRLLIWSFTGDRIAERPLLGWGLDASRSIPGGKVEIRPGQTWLPLHPHNAALQLWLELGAPGAVLFALLLGLLWQRLGEAPWPRLYAAAAGGSLTAALTIALSGWGIWQEWWLGTLAIALFAIMVMARTAGLKLATPPLPRDSRAADR